MVNTEKTSEQYGKTHENTANSMKVPARDQVFPEPTVGGLIANLEGKILLTKSHKWYGKYTLPGGHVELGETLERAVVREIKEETGLDVKVIEFILHQEAIYSKEFYKPRHFIFFDYYCKIESDQAVKLDQKELQEFIWVYPGAAYNLDLDSFTKNTLNRFLSRGL